MVHDLQECRKGFAVQGLYCVQCGKVNELFKAIAAPLLTLAIFMIYSALIIRPLFYDVEDRVKASISQKVEDYTAKIDDLRAKRSSGGGQSRSFIAIFLERITLLSFLKV